MSIKTKKRMPKCNCYPHPAFPNDPDFSVMERNETNYKWADLFLKCNICGKVAKNAIKQKYAEKRQFPIAPSDWDRGPHPDFKERWERWEYEQNLKLIAALEKRENDRENETRERFWQQLPSGIIVPRRPH